MTVKELIQNLQEYDQDLDVKILQNRRLEELEVTTTADAETGYLTIQVKNG